jgi:putative glutamine amidotransferase
MRPRIAIPLPHSFDREYAERAIPQYERAIEQAGGEPVRVALDQELDEMKRIAERCAGALLPGSKADVDPAKFYATRSPHTAAADQRRQAADEVLLFDAYNLRKPVLGICYGLQSLNVFRGGSLIQHIPDCLPENLRTRINHEAGKKIAVAHEVMIENNSKLAEIVKRKNWEGRDFSRAYGSLGEKRPLGPEGREFVLPVNSSHHQSADAIGEALGVVARCPDDGVIEALEGTDRDHFVLAVQWHPERSLDQDEFSRAIFRALIEAAGSRTAS